MSDLNKISEDLQLAYDQWAAMRRDLERCRQKVEHMKAELSMAESQDQAHQLASMVLLMSYNMSQYEQQIARFPLKVAELRSKLTYLVVAPAEFLRQKAHSNC